MSMARSTPAQKPRGPARTISPIRVTIRLLLKIKGYARPPGIRLETTNGVRGVAVGDVDQPVPGVEGHIVRHEVRRAHAAGQPEREARVDLHDLEVGAAGRGEHLDVRHEPPQRQDVIPTGQREARVVGDRKSTRLNSSHLVISYAVFCLKKKKQNKVNIRN